jgi:hypothetical protein
VKLTTHLHLVPRSRMRGAIPPFLQYVFMAWYLVKHRDNIAYTLHLPLEIPITLNLSVMTSKFHALPMYVLIDLYEISESPCGERGIRIVPP